MVLLNGKESVFVIFLFVIGKISSWLFFGAVFMIVI